MQVFETIKDFRAARQAVSGDLGFVPTMGYLHDGHLELVRYALRQNTQVAVSIFVNPTQFGPHEDFSGYPRDMQRDLAQLKALGAHLVFTPSVTEMYPPNFQTYVEVESVSQGLEGARRPGHFRGVATVVNKLLNIIQPQRAYFGQKDAQQCAVIRQMVADLAIPTEIVIVPTIRAEDGLALSSRNSYLTAEQREAASVLYRALSAAKARYADGERNPDHLRDEMLEVLAQEPLAQVEYVSVADAFTLHELTETITRSVLLSMAVRIGKARLIDNMMIEVE